MPSTRKSHLRRSSAKQSVKNGLGSPMATWTLFNTSQLRNFSSYNYETLHVRRTHLPRLVGIRQLGVAPRIREIYTSSDFSSCRPALFSCAPANVKCTTLIIN